jgi:hypothetical protein
MGPVSIEMIRDAGAGGWSPVPSCSFQPRPFVLGMQQVALAPGERGLDRTRVCHGRVVGSVIEARLINPIRQDRVFSL